MQGHWISFRYKISIYSVFTEHYAIVLKATRK